MARKLSSWKKVRNKFKKFKISKIHFTYFTIIRNLLHQLTQVRDKLEKFNELRRINEKKKKEKGVTGEIVHQMTYKSIFRSNVVYFLFFINVNKKNK